MMNTLNFKTKLTEQAGLCLAWSDTSKTGFLAIGLGSFTGCPLCLVDYFWSNPICSYNYSHITEN